NLALHSQILGSISSLQTGIPFRVSGNHTPSRSCLDPPKRSCLQFFGSRLWGRPAFIFGLPRKSTSWVPAVQHLKKKPLPEALCALSAGRACQTMNAFYDFRLLWGRG